MVYTYWDSGHQLGHYQRNWEAGRHLEKGEELTLTQIVSSLVKKMGCVRGRVLVRGSRLEQEDFVQKKVFLRLAAAL